MSDVNVRICPPDTEPACICTGPYPDAACQQHGIGAMLRAMWAAEDSRWGAEGNVGELLGGTE